MKNFLTLFLMGISCTLIAQSKSDCNSGYLICDHSSVQITDAGSTGEDPRELENFISECLSEEFQSTWFRWECKDAGSFGFTITPDNYVSDEISDDIDFAVLRLTNGINNCEDKEMIRCMASGQSGGCSFDQWMACNGPTGLSESSGDSEEFPGCSRCNGGSDDNFLSAIDMEAGTAYALVVLKYTESDQGYKIDWHGTGTLKDFGQECEQATISSTKNLSANQPRILAYPNPANNSINFKAENFSKKLSVEVYNSQGNKVTSFNLRDFESIDVSELPSGLYYYRTPMDERIKTGKFTKS